MMSRSSLLSAGSSAHDRQLSTPPPIMSLSLAEFSRIIVRSDMPTLLAATFNNDGVTMMALCHYHFVVKTIEKLEEEIEQQVIEQQVIEQQDILARLLRRRRFRERITPIVADY